MKYYFLLFFLSSLFEYFNTTSQSYCINNINILIIITLYSDNVTIILVDISTGLYHVLVIPTRLILSVVLQRQEIRADNESYLLLSGLEVQHCITKKPD